MRLKATNCSKVAKNQVTYWLGKAFVCLFVSLEQINRTYNLEHGNDMGCLPWDADLSTAHSFVIHLQGLFFC